MSELKKYVRLLRPVLSLLVASLAWEGCGTSARPEVGSRGDTDGQLDAGAGRRDTGAELGAPFRSLGSRPLVDLDEPAARQLRWLLEVLGMPELPPPSQLRARFSPAFWAELGEQLPGFLESVRADFARPTISDIVMLTPTWCSVVIESSGSRASALVELSTRLSSEEITMLRIRGVETPSSIAEADRDLELDEVVEALGTLGDASVLVAQGVDGSCREEVSLDAEEPRAVGSVFKLWVLGAVVSRIDQAPGLLEETIALSEMRFAPSGGLEREGTGLDVSIVDLSTLMMGQSDNTATEHLFAWVSREAAERTLRDLGHRHRREIEPFLSPLELFHLHWTVSEIDALEYPSLAEDAQREFLRERLSDRGPIVDFSSPNDRVLVEGSWKASALDICRGLARLSMSSPAEPSHTLLERALGANAGVFGLRSKWDRVWFKGGSLESASSGVHVLALAWLLQDMEGLPEIIIVAVNSSAGGVDQGRVISLGARLVELRSARGQ